MVPSRNFQYALRGPRKLCPACEHQSPASLPFCTYCGEEISDTPALIAPQSDGKQFQLPGYLVSDEQRESYYDREHVGTGLVWGGIALITVPAVTSNLSPMSLGAWAAGLALVLAGMIRARVDRQALFRSGAIAGLASVVVIAVLANQVIRTDTSGAIEIAAPDETADQVEESTGADTDSAATEQNLDGVVPVIRGNELNTGVYPGPGLEGDPFRLWRYDTGAMLLSTPVIGNQTAYFGTRDGYLVAIDLVTGQPRWKYDLGGFPVTGAPALGERLVYVASGYKVFAIDAERGKDNGVWKNYEMSYAGESSPIYSDGSVYVGSKETRVHTLDAITGDPGRTYRADEELFFGSPAVGSEVIVIGGDSGTIYAWDLESGVNRWEFEAEGGVYSSPLIFEDSVFVTDTSNTVNQLDLVTGEVLWTYPVGGEASPAFDGETLIIASHDGGIYALDPESESPEKWVFPTTGGDMQSPALVGTTIYAVSGSTIYALDLENGSELWSYPLGSIATTEPVIVDGVLYIGAEDGNLYAITGTGESPEESTG